MSTCDISLPQLQAAFQKPCKHPHDFLPMNMKKERYISNIATFHTHSTALLCFNQWLTKYIILMHACVAASSSHIRAVLYEFVDLEKPLSLSFSFL